MPLTSALCTIANVVRSRISRLFPAIQFQVRKRRNHRRIVVAKAPGVVGKSDDAGLLCRKETAPVEFIDEDRIRTVQTAAANVVE